ncbi:hypothetical protein GCM10027075_01210 [Streptomyces heilongjiangensis]
MAPRPSPPLPPEGFPGPPRVRRPRGRRRSVCYGLGVASGGSAPVFAAWEYHSALDLGVRVSVA